MKKIISKKKVVTKSRTAEENFVEFSNIRVTQSTAKNFVNVSMDIYKRIDTEHIVVVEDQEETIVNSKYEKIETISDSYDSALVDALVSEILPNKPEEIEGFFDTNTFLYLNIAKNIIANDSANYFGLVEANLEIV